MSHYKSENQRFPLCDYCLPSKDAFEPCCGSVVPLPAHVIPNDIPNPLLDSYSDQFNSQPEQVMAQFLEANPNFANPRDMGRILYFTPNLSPFAIALILFNSQYSSRALTFSFMSAIDMDCLSIVDAMCFILQKVAIPNMAFGIIYFASVFASAYGLRNKLEWPNLKVINDLFCASVCFTFKGGEFKEHIKKFSSLDDINPCMLEQIGATLIKKPPAIYFTNITMKVDNSEVMSEVIEQEGRYRSSWNSGKYTKEGDMIKYKDMKDRELGQIPLVTYKMPDGSELDQIPSDMANEPALYQHVYVIAKQKTGVPKRPYCLNLYRYDNKEFGLKVKKDGGTKPSPRTNYCLSFKTEAGMFKWLSAINYKCVSDDLSMLN